MGTVHAKARPGDDVRARRPLEKDEERQEIVLEGVPARVDKINVSGLGRTKDDIVNETVRELFKARDFQDVILKAHTVRNRLEALGCFRNIGVYIDTSSGPQATADGLEVTFYVRELKRVVGGVNTAVGNNEGSLVVGVKLPNMLGRGERLQAEYSYSLKRSNNCSVQLVKPLLGWRGSVLSASAYQAASEWPWSGYRQLERGVLLDLAFPGAGGLLQHNVQWDAAVRQLAAASRATSFAVREQAGLSLKSALRHVLRLDTRDEPIFPRGGLLLQLSTELAGLGGDVAFVKNELQAQASRALLADVVLQAGAQLGVLHAAAGPGRRVTLADQFFVGGPLSLRGFQARGVGPHADGDALGSDVYWAAALHLYAPLPFSPGRGGFGDLFRTHLFVNAGNVAPLKPGAPADALAALRDRVRVAYGLGVAVRVGHMARIELNYCFPLAYQRGDQLHPGVQFGIGLHFL